ncbi:hypothetical protein K1719_003210 [Acacia pycnantha]|nr:hypothetical protein K1719_003210 [Acacia pycnantha]
MQAIGKTHQKNLVRLLGYCAEGSKRLLVYEFISNGSLEKLIFGDSIVCPGWDQRRRIALNIARGLLYLHEQCRAPIIHYDIKPHHILMDEFWTAKISDSGLAKQVMYIQDEPFRRQSMKSVVLMLEGVTEVAIPPSPSPNSM